MDAGIETAMLHALKLARRAWGQTHPNPMVGAVILEGGEIVAEGWHERTGQDHAEIAALKALGRQPAPDAILCVTLEPCSTEGRTGSCTKAIQESGIQRIAVGTIDPNPDHAGRGIQLLEEAGLEVVQDVCEAECRDLNLIFNHWIVSGRPLIAAKIATTLDGKVATREGHSRWITGPTARQNAHQWRKLFPAIACGSGTVQADNPSLTIRLEGEPVGCPRRFIFDRSLSVLETLNATVFNDTWCRQSTVVCSESADPDRIDQIQQKGLDLWQLPASSDADFFAAFSLRCAESGLTGVLVEGGPRLLSALLGAGGLDYLFAYRAPKLLADEQALDCFRGQPIGHMDQAFQLQQVRHEALGDDQLMRGFVKKP